MVEMFWAVSLTIALVAIGVAFHIPPCLVGRMLFVNGMWFGIVSFMNLAACLCGEECK